VIFSDITYNPKEVSKSTTSTILSVGKSLLTHEASAQLGEYADDVRAAVVEGVSMARRLRVVDAESAPDFYVDGIITNITTTSKLITPTDKKKAPYTAYKAQIRVTLNFVNRVDGTIVDSYAFSITEGNSVSWFDTKETALNRALSDLAAEICEHYEHVFPLYAQLEEAGEVKKDKQKEIYINLGSDIGIVKDDEFMVYVLTTIGTKEARQEIGRIKVSEVMGSEVSRCKVTKGGDKIKAAIDASSHLLIVTK
jgi:hypothetical protein